MALEFKDVLSGEGMGGGEEEGQALIQYLACPIPKPCQGCHARYGHVAENSLGDQAHPGSGNPNHAYTAESGRRGNGGNGVGRHGSGL